MPSIPQAYRRLVDPASGKAFRFFGHLYFQRAYFPFLLWFLNGLIIFF